MSETRPPITAGPMARAFRFLKRISVSGGAVADGDRVAAEDNGGGVLAGDAVGEAAVSGGALGDAFISRR